MLSHFQWYLVWLCVYVCVVLYLSRTFNLTNFVSILVVCLIDYISLPIDTTDGEFSLEFINPFQFVQIIHPFTYTNYYYVMVKYPR